MGYLVTKSLKNKGVGILLVLFLGPLGLFYSSLFGGTLMSLVGILSIFLALASSSESMLLLIFIAYPICIIICLIWATISISKYNNEIEQSSLQFSDIIPQQNNPSAQEVIDYGIAYRNEFYPSKKSNYNTVLILLTMFILLFLGFYNRDRLLSFFNTEDEVIKSNKNLKGKFSCSDQCIFSSFEFKGNSTVSINGLFVSSYVLDEEYVRIKTDKTDLLLKIKDSNTLVGEGFASGIFIKTLELKRITPISQTKPKNKTNIKDELHKILLETNNAILSDPENIADYYLGELDYKDHPQNYIITKVLDAKKVELKNDYASQGDYYLYTEELDKSKNKVSCEYHFTLINNKWKLKEYRFTDADEGT